MSLTVICSLLKQKTAKSNLNIPVISYALVFIEVLSFSLLYTLTPHMGRGPLYDTSRLYNYEFAEQFKDGRYLHVGYKIKTASDKTELEDLSENLNYNLARLYGINNVSGYFSFLSNSDVLVNNDCFLHMYFINGNVYEYYPGLIEQMREQSVNWYIVCPSSRNEFEEAFEESGIEYVSEADHSVIFYNPYAQPLA